MVPAGRMKSGARSWPPAAPSPPRASAHTCPQHRVSAGPQAPTHEPDGCKVLNSQSRDSAVRRDAQTWLWGPLCDPGFREMVVLSEWELLGKGKTPQKELMTRPSLNTGNVS